MQWFGKKPKVAIPAEKVLIVAFAFATPPEAFVNGVLRREVCHLQQNVFADKAWVFTQPDLATGLEDIFKLKTIDEEEGKPSPTLRIARQAAKWAKELGSSEIHLVGAAPHMWRIVRDMKAVLREAKMKLPVVVERIPEVGWFGWFHKSSTQKRTQSAFAWYQRDLILWLIPYFIYKRIAG